MLMEASKRDAFVDLVTQSGTLPHMFSHGVYRTVQHRCTYCGKEVRAECAYGKQILVSGSLTRQNFHENQVLLDSVGNVFSQHLHHTIDVNGFKAYIYLTSEREDSALLKVACYRCAHCQI